MYERGWMRECVTSSLEKDKRRGEETKTKADGLCCFCRYLWNSSTVREKEKEKEKEDSCEMVRRWCGCVARILPRKERTS